MIPISTSPVAGSRIASGLVLAAVTSIACLGGCRGGATEPATPRRAAQQPPLPAEEAWLTQLDRDHPLVGKIWDVARRSFVDVAEARARTVERPLLLLGEKHDNPDHHRLQGWLVDGFASHHPDAVVAFEMFDVAQQPAIDAYRRTSSADAEGLGPALAWEKTGWPAWRSYLPIARVAMEKGLAIRAANLPNERVRAIAHEGVAALGQPTVARLGLDQPFPEPLEASLLSELRASHCGHLPESALPRMAAAQHARDAQMASAIAESGTAAVLIAGAGHARKDHGVPFYVARSHPHTRLTSVAFLEVEKELTSPELYASRFGGGSLPFDLVWFTPRATDDDPCAVFHGKTTR